MHALAHLHHAVLFKHHFLTVARNSSGLLTFLTHSPLDGIRRRLQALRTKLDAFGWRAPLLSVLSRVLPVGTPVRVHARGVAKPMYLRLRTTDMPTYMQVFVERQYSSEIAKAPRTIIDAGANIGLSAIWFANQYPDARILCIEPDAANFALLQRNVAAYPQVIAIRGALWNENTTLELFDSGSGSWGFQTRAPSREDVARVPAFTVDQLMQEYGLDSVDLLKIDIEGAEKEVLENASSWIDRVGVLVVELHERFKPGCEAAFQRVAPRFATTWEQGEHIFAARPGWVPPAAR